MAASIRKRQVQNAHYHPPSADSLHQPEFADRRAFAKPLVRAQSTFRPRQLKPQVATNGIDLYSGHIRVAPTDQRWISTRRDGVRALEYADVSGIAQVDPRIQIVVSHAHISWDVGMPLRRVAANEKVSNTG